MQYDDTDEISSKFKEPLEAYLGMTAAMIDGSSDHSAPY